MAVFNKLNAERTNCGFGLLAQHAQLDVSAKGHGDWLLINNAAGHYQVANTTGFTGLTPTARATAAGYTTSSTVSEAATAGPAAKASMGVVGFVGLLNAPYHVLNMMRGYRDVGVSVRENFDVGLSPNNRMDVVLAFGVTSTAGFQAPASGSVRTFPCDGSTGVERALYNETPNPVPTRNLWTSPLGSSIAITADTGSALVITSASMINAGTGAAVTLLAPITAATDPNKVNGVSYLGSNEGFVSADAPLAASTKYQVTITGTSNGTAFSRTFMFTTGA